MFTKLMLLALSVLSPLHLTAQPLDFDLSLILAQKFTIGSPCFGTELDANGNKLADDGSLTIDGVRYQFYLRDGTGKQLIGCKSSVVFWDDYGGDRYIIWAPRVGIFPAGGHTTDSLQGRRDRLRSLAREYLSEASCSTAMLELLSQLDGPDQQLAVNRIFNNPPVDEADVKCLISQTDSRMAVSNDSFEPPHTSDEGVYYHRKKYRGELIEIILPNLFGVRISTLGGVPRNEEERQRLKNAWAHWLHVSLKIQPVSLRTFKTSECGLT